MAANLTPAETRAQDADFVIKCSMSGLEDCLPLLWPAPPDVPPSPKNDYRSPYVYFGWDDLDDPAVWEYLSDFDLLLRLVDFSPLRPVLAQLLGWTSARGWKPFDPISIFLLMGWPCGIFIPRGWLVEYLPLFHRAGRLPTAGTAPRPCATCVTLATLTTPCISASRTALSPPKAASAITSPPWAGTQPVTKPSSSTRSGASKSPSSASTS